MYVTCPPCHSHSSAHFNCHTLIRTLNPAPTYRPYSLSNSHHTNTTFTRYSLTLHPGLRPFGYDKVTTAREQILETLAARGGKIEGLGDRSSPEAVWAVWTGMSKGQVRRVV